MCSLPSKYLRTPGVILRIEAKRQTEFFGARLQETRLQRARDDPIMFILLHHFFHHLLNQLYLRLDRRCGPAIRNEGVKDFARDAELAPQAHIGQLPRSNILPERADFSTENEFNLRQRKEFLF